MALPPIKGLLETTLLDWEGRVAAEIFLGGCNFRCPFCHARHLLSDTGQEAIPLASVDACLCRNIGWIDGVIVSGGEPTLQSGLADLLHHFRDMEVPVKLDTNGSRPDVLAGLIDAHLIDTVAMDVKAPLDERYSACAGVEVDIEAIRRSIELIIGSPIEHEFRTTVCPAFHDADAIAHTALAVRGARRYVLQRFRPVNCLDPTLLDVQPYNDEQMRDFADIARKYVDFCQVRGDQESVSPRKA